MQDLTIGLIQLHSVVGQSTQNLDRTEDWIKRAAEQGAHLIVLPELNVTGHAGDAEMIADAQPVPQGPGTQRMLRMAQTAQAWIAFGIAEDDRGVTYNTQVLVSPEGYIGKQRKVHLSRDEYFYFRGGQEASVFQTPWGRVGIVICYDSFVPEVSRCMAVQGAELLLCPHAARFGAWPADRPGREAAVKEMKRQWRLIHPARAYDNGVYVALCNAVGSAADHLPGVEANHAGGCMVVDPSGQVLAESAAADIEEELLLVQLRGEAVKRRRLDACFNLRTRRPEVFGPLTQ